MMDYKKLFDMTGKVCIITGGTGYLGSACANAMKAFGATVAVASRRSNSERGEEQMDLDCDLFVKCDVSSAESVRACFQEVYDKYGRIDVLVNCANGNTSVKNNSGTHGNFSGFGNQSDMEFMADEVFEAGVMRCIAPAFRGMREVVPFMKQNGGGSIINFSSMYGLVSPDLRVYGDSYQRQPANYGAGKAAVVQVTRYAACSLAKHNIRVNCVTPGPFPKPVNAKDEELNEKLASHTMLGRLGKNHELAGAVLLLASDASSFMTGSNIVVDGGWTAW